MRDRVWDIASCCDILPFASCFQRILKSRHLSGMSCHRKQFPRILAPRLRWTENLASPELRFRHKTIHGIEWSTRRCDEQYYCVSIVAKAVCNGLAIPQNDEIRFQRSVRRGFTELCCESSYLSWILIDLVHSIIVLVFIMFIVFSVDILVCLSFNTLWLSFEVYSPPKSVGRVRYASCILS